MNLNDFLEWGTRYFAEYFAVLVTTLIDPAVRFSPSVDTSRTTRLVLPARNYRDLLGPRLNPRLFGFMVVSILIGSTLALVTPGHPTMPDFLTISIVTLSVWMAYSITVFLLCRAVGGKGDFWNTISVSLQLLAVIYVVSNFLTFVFGSIAPTFGNLFLDSFHDGALSLLVTRPAVVYYPVQLILMLIYLPVALKDVHGLSVGRLIVVALVPMVWTIWSLFSFYGNFVSVVPPTSTAVWAPLPTATWMPLPTPASTPTFIP